MLDLYKIFEEVGCKIISTNPKPKTSIDFICRCGKNGKIYYKYNTKIIECNTCRSTRARKNDKYNKKEFEQWLIQQNVKFRKE
jgi:hypothetical protein